MTMPLTTESNPLVTIHSQVIGDNLIGNMHLSTAASIHNFDQKEMLKNLKAAGENRVFSDGWNDVPVFVKLDNRN